MCAAEEGARGGKGETGVSQGGIDEAGVRIFFALGDGCGGAAAPLQQRVAAAHGLRLLLASSSEAAGDCVVGVVGFGLGVVDDGGGALDAAHGECSHSVICAAGGV